MEDMITRFEGLTFYDILEIPANASYFEVRQAYKEVLAIYSEDSLATYSLLTDIERDRILKKVEEAFFVLIDEQKRADYDRELIREGKLEESALNHNRPKKAIPLFHSNKSKCKEVFAKKIRKKISRNHQSSTQEKTLSQSLISGRDLMKLRESLGIELEEIFEITRININTLKSIENDQFEGLPPSVYLENFLKSYADILHLDSKKVVSGYFNNMAKFQDPDVSTPQ